MAIEDKSDGRTVQLKHVRLSFTDSLKDKKPTVENGTPKHSFNIILEASDPHFEDNKKKVVAALQAASEKEFKDANRWKAIAEDDPKRVCFRKGERFKNAEGKIYAGYEGNLAIALSGPSGGQKRPKLLDRHKRPVEEADILDVMYGGCYADVIISLYGTKKGGPGVFGSGEAIRSHQEGERIGGGIYVDADDFDDMEDDDSFDSGPSTSSKSSSSSTELDF